MPPDLHSQLDRLTATIREATAALQSAYTAETLYAWRVAGRRIRSLLKPLRSKRARRLRRSWGVFVRVTSRARDWDVFLHTAGELLEADDYRQFERDNASHVDHSRDAVLSMLASPRWSSHLEAWAAWLERSGRHPRRASPGSLPRALVRAQQALATARTVGDSHSWHRFRIAVKEVRYLAESHNDGHEQPDPSDAAHGPLVERCKELQSLLGAWHDSVVQEHLLVDLAPTPLHDALLRTIRERHDRQLAAILAAVTDQPLFPAVGAGHNSARSSPSSGS